MSISSVNLGTKIAVVDLFAGPGGLAEGFSAVTNQQGDHPFDVVLSVEKEKAAHSTLLLRTFLRQFKGGFPEEYYTFLNRGTAEPNWQELYPHEWESAKRNALLLELGPAKTDALLDGRIDEIRRTYRDNIILIGGPPCQAYSLVGRARNNGIVGYLPEKDARHTLYKNYIKVLARLQPAAFVMENVKGMLSSSLNKKLIFERVMEDLSNAGCGYRLLALAPKNGGPDLFSALIQPTDFILRSEEYGLPQTRHRVIVVGIRSDINTETDLQNIGQLIVPYKRRVNVEDVLEEMPRLRSGLSRGDSAGEWAKAISDAAIVVNESIMFWPPKERKAFQNRVEKCAKVAKASMEILSRSASKPNAVCASCPPKLKRWIRDARLHVLPNSETRAHMPSDITRYLFASVYAELIGISPKSTDFPPSLAPNHRNWDSGKFNDRFRVQVWGQPSTTITSHISKDGHYFIHPDPEQCRSLTVREAARLQTFPDNYYFKGSRTEQFIQVGNAVPPFLATQIAVAILQILDCGSKTA
jgi:DNA (cytosine-5)-methyltransferase 1